MRLSKEDCIKAVMTEPLVRMGEWAVVPGEKRGFPKPRERRQKTRADAKGCRVCAVGAVLRGPFNGYGSVEELARVCHVAVRGFCTERENVEANLRDEDYLGALSAMFESQPGKRVTKAHRQELVDFIQARFPAFIEVPALGKFIAERKAACAS